MYVEERHTSRAVKFIKAAHTICNRGNGRGVGRVGEVDDLDAVVIVGGDDRVGAAAYLEQVYVSYAIQYSGCVVGDTGHRTDLGYRRSQYGNLDGCSGVYYPVAEQVGYGTLVYRQGRGGVGRLHLGGVEGGPDDVVIGRLVVYLVQCHVAQLPSDGQPGVVGGGVVEGFVELEGQEAIGVVVGGFQGGWDTVVDGAPDDDGYVGGRLYLVARQVGYGALVYRQGRGGADSLHLGGVECGPDDVVIGRPVVYLVQCHVAQLPSDGQPGVVGGGVVEGLAEVDVQDAGALIVVGRRDCERCVVCDDDARWACQPQVYHSVCAKGPNHCHVGAAIGNKHLDITGPPGVRDVRQVVRVVGVCQVDHQDAPRAGAISVGGDKGVGAVVHRQDGGGPRGRQQGTIRRGHLGYLDGLGRIGDVEYYHAAPVAMQGQGVGASVA